MAREAIVAFATGINGRQPEPRVVETANKITSAALSMTVEPEVTLDVDGALSFDLRTGNGHLIIAELSPDGVLDASVYDAQDKLLKRMPAATAAELIARFSGEPIGLPEGQAVEADISTVEDVDLERYGFKLIPHRGVLVTNELVNEIREELGI